MLWRGGEAGQWVLGAVDHPCKCALPCRPVRMINKVVRFMFLSVTCFV